MNQRRRIAVISAHTSPLVTPGCRESGGMNVYVRELSRELGRRGYLLDIFTRRYDESTPSVLIPFENVRVVHLRAGREDEDGKHTLLHHLQDFERELVAFQAVEGIDYDLLHTHYWLSGCVGLELRARWQVPLVAMSHTLAEEKNRLPVGEKEPVRRLLAERRIAQEADVIVCAGDHERRVLVETYEANPRHIAVIPCGVDVNRFRPLDQSASRHALGMDGRSVLLFVGRIEPLKGVDILLEAAARLAGGPAPQVVIVGGDATGESETARLRSLAAEIGLDGRARFIGPVEHERLPLYYNAADVCVVPSYYESFGLVALEAMACGTPVVASRVGGLNETVRDSETGFLVPSHEPVAFADRIATLLADERRRRAFGQAAREAVSAFAWSNVADAIESVYLGLLSKTEADDARCLVAGL